MNTWHREKPVHRLELTPRAQGELDQITGKDFDRLVESLKLLRETPFPPQSKKLRRSIYRIRTGNWRIIYAVFKKEKLIIVGKIVRRSETTYDGIDRLF